MNESKADSMLELLLPRQAGLQKKTKTKKKQTSDLAFTCHQWTQIGCRVSTAGRDKAGHTSAAVLTCFSVYHGKKESRVQLQDVGEYCRRQWDKLHLCSAASAEFQIHSQKTHPSQLAGMNSSVNLRLSF